MLCCTPESVCDIGILVRRGAALLDGTLQNWRDRVRGKHFDVRYNNADVLALVFGSLDQGERVLGLTHKEAEDYGFGIDWARVPAYQAHWEAAIAVPSVAVAA